MANPIVHFEIPADDPKRASAFYTKIFGWKIKYFKEMDYYVVSAKEGKHGIDGGIMKRKNPGQPFTNYIAVPSIDAHLKKIVANGGKVCLPKMPIGEMGFIAAFQDPEGNLLGLHEMARPKKKAKTRK